jgi:hypothetical protein
MTAGICAHLLKLERDLAIKGKTAWAPGAENREPIYRDMRRN